MSHHTVTVTHLHACEVPNKTNTLSLTTARADHRRILIVGAKEGTAAAAAIIQAGLSSVAVPFSIPLSA